MQRGQSIKDQSPNHIPSIAGGKRQLSHTITYATVQNLQAALFLLFIFPNHFQSLHLSGMMTAPMLLCTSIIWWSVLAKFLPLPYIHCHHTFEPRLERGTSACTCVFSCTYCSLTNISDLYSPITHPAVALLHSKAWHGRKQWKRL